MTPNGHITWHLRDGSTRRTAAYGSLNLLAHAEAYGIRLPQACGGQAECGTCRVRVVSGSLTPVRGDEAELREGHRRAFAEDERLACQARPLGDVEVSLLRKVPRDLRER